MLREILYDLRANGIVMALKAVVIALVGLGVYNVHAFSESSEAAIDRSFSSQADVTMYTMFDGLYDPDIFAEFRASSERVDSAARFSDLLNQDTKINLISAFDNQVPVRDFPGDETFHEYYGQGLRETDPTWTRTGEFSRK